MMRSDFLPGDGSLQAIREEHAENGRRITDPKAVKPNPFAYAKIEFLLAEIDHLNAEIADLKEVVKFITGSDLHGRSYPRPLHRQEPKPK